MRKYGAQSQSDRVMLYVLYICITQTDFEYHCSQLFRVRVVISRPRPFLLRTRLFSLLSCFHTLSGFSLANYYVFIRVVPDTDFEAGYPGFERTDPDIWFFNKLFESFFHKFSCSEKVIFSYNLFSRK